MHIGETIRRLRTKQQITQSQLAEALGVSTQTVSKWESGTHMPDYTMLAPLSRILHTEMLDLIAVYFGVSRRELMGVRREDEKTLYNTLIKLPKESREALETARELYEQKPLYIFNYIDILLHQTEEREKCLAEARLLIRSHINSPQCSENDKYYFLSQILHYEEDERLEEWLAYYPTELNMLLSRQMALASRYAFRGEWDKYKAHREKILLKLVESVYIFTSAQMYPDREEMLFLYDFLHLVFGDTLDVYPQMQINVCICLAGMYAQTGEIEESYRYLSEAERLFRDLAALPEDAEITSKNPLLGSKKIPVGERRSWIFRDYCHIPHYPIPEEMREEPRLRELLDSIEKIANNNKQGEKT